MRSLPEIIGAFTRGIARSRVSLMGAMVVTVVFPLLLGAIIYDIVWHIKNTYVAALIYMVLGPTFIAGLIGVFLGLFFFKGKEEVRLFTLEYLRDYFTDPTKFTKMRKLVFFAVFLTCVNLFIFGLLGYRGYHYMESVAFCGKFCHTVMNPEFTAYSNSPHSRVPCVECHIGAGATWFVKSKISGARQLFAVALDTYPRPIETPVHGLRPARDTCEECHRPELFHGEKLLVREHFQPDEKNSNVHSVLLMKIGSAGDRAVSPHGIHWHVAPENTITYVAESHEREVIPTVTLSHPDGSTTVFTTEGGEPVEVGPEAETRTMDCIDCHNRPTHIYLSADQALDRKLQEGLIPRELPFIKRQALEAIKQKYPSHEAGRVAIAAQLTDWYQDNEADFLQNNPGMLERAIDGACAAWSENVFPEMNVQWDTYINQIGHGPDFDIGCFRCHDGMHESSNGQTISADCDTCHVILAEREPSPPILKTIQGM